MQVQMTRNKGGGGKNRSSLISPVRLLLWWLIEKASLNGRKVLTLRQHRRFCSWLNGYLLEVPELSIPEATDNRRSADAEQLQKHGWCKVTGIDSALIQDVVEAVRKVAYDRIGRAECRPNPSTLASKESLLQLQPIRKLLSQTHLNDIADLYLNEKAFIRDVDVLRSVVQPNLAGAQLFHLDNINNRALRLVVILEQIDNNHGPLTFFPLEQSRSIVSGLRYMDRRDYNLLKDDEIGVSVSQYSPILLTGEPGDMFLIDPCSCLHCGSRVTEGHRLLMMATFTPWVPTNIRWLRSGVFPQLLDPRRIEAVGI